MCVMQIKNTRKQYPFNNKLLEMTARKKKLDKHLKLRI